MYSQKPVNWIIAFYVAYILCSIVPNLLPGIVTQLFPIAALAFCCIFYSTECFTNKAFLCACIYAVGIFLASQFHILSGLGYGHGGMDTVLIDIGFTLPSVAMGAVLLRNPRIIKAVRLVDIFIYASILISVSYMIPILLTDRSIARKIASLSAAEMDSEMLEFKFGYWNYTMCHIISLFFALFTGLFLTSKGYKRRIFYGAMAAIVAFMVLNLTITTTFIYFFIVIAFLLYRKFKRYNFIGVVTIVVAGILFVSNLDAIMDYLLISYEDTDMSEKIVDIDDLLGGGSGEHITIDARAQYQQGAIDGFFNNILIGSSYEGSGGHSIILNRLGTTGLIGFIPFMLMLYFIFKQWYAAIPKESKTYYLLSWLGATILLYNKNCFGSAGFCFICIVMPCLCLTFQYEKTILPPK